MEISTDIVVVETKATKYQLSQMELKTAIAQYIYRNICDCTQHSYQGLHSGEFEFEGLSWDKEVSGVTVHVVDTKTTEQPTPEETKP